jgi:hypothetical protein
MAKGVKFFLPLCLILACLSTACKKEKTEPAKTPTQLLTGKAWILHAAGFDGNGNGIIDKEEDVLRDCERDNTLLFSTNGKGTVSDNNITCGIQSDNEFTWKLVSGNELLIDNNSISIVQLTDTRFTYTPKLDGLVHPFVIEYRR